MFLAVAEARRSAVICVRARARVARVHVLRGTLVNVEGVDSEPLGDALLRQGVLDVMRHRAAMQIKPPQGKVGSWLVAVGVAPRSAVQDALEDQLEARIATLLRWPEAIFDMLPEAPVVREGEVQAELTCAVWNALLKLATELPVGTLAALSGDVPLRLTRSGERLLGALERAGETVPRVALLSRAPASAQRPGRAALRALGGAMDAAFDGDACSLLLRKQREIRRHVDPRALLDLPPHARPEHVRPALRRLAHKLHPDRFQASDPELQAVSSEVMRALSQAERELLRASSRAR
jgi:hypothetical protein